MDGAGARDGCATVSSECIWRSGLRIQPRGIVRWPAEKVNEDRLTGRGCAVPHKPALEKHLKEKLGEFVRAGLRLAAV